jgi:hypothetical protein
MFKKQRRHFPSKAEGHWSPFRLSFFPKALRAVTIPRDVCRPNPAALAYEAEPATSFHLHAACPAACVAAPLLQKPETEQLNQRTHSSTPLRRTVVSAVSIAPGRSSSGNSLISSTTCGIAAMATLRNAFSSTVSAIIVNALPCSTVAGRRISAVTRPIIPCEPKAPASAQSGTPRGLRSSNSYPRRLCSKTASNQVVVAPAQSDRCTCRIDVYQYAVMQKAKQHQRTLMMPAELVYRESDRNQ